MSLPDIPPSLLAEMQLVAKKMFKHWERELERRWRSLWGSRWERSEGYASSDADYGEAYIMADWAAEEILRRGGFPDITEKFAFVGWTGDRVEMEEYNAHSSP